jgi:RNA recognition motif-containing protein
MNIYVGNLSLKTRENELRGKFEAFGAVKSVVIVTDGYTGRSKGFGYVEMLDPAEAKAAIAEMNGKQLDLSPLIVKEAKPRGVASKNGFRLH